MSSKLPKCFRQVSKFVNVSVRVAAPVVSNALEVTVHMILIYLRLQYISNILLSLIVKY